ncbi:MAG: hypothetical protein KKG64_04030, partial [Firmicutes bacterium]|nr:hypothetical protein [Bacillota bacterium]
MDIFYQLIQTTYISMTVLLIVAMGGLLAERSGVTNIALEGIMVFGAFIGIWAVAGLENYPYTTFTIIIIFIVLFAFLAIISWGVSRLLKKRFKMNHRFLLINLAIILILAILFTFLVSKIQMKTQMV